MAYALKDILLRSQRLSGTRRPIAIINPQRYEEFFAWLGASSDFDPDLQTFVSVCVSGGLRVSEGLSIQRQHVDLAQGFVRVKVLKKKSRCKGKRGWLRVHTIYREVKLHAVALGLLKAYVARTPTAGFSKIFAFRRNHVHRHVKRVFGPEVCCHSLFRHSHISWLLDAKHIPEATVAKVMEISRRIVENYSHVDRRAQLNDLYETPGNNVVPLRKDSA